MQAGGTHQIIPFGNDLMRLYDSHSGETVVVASRDGGVWTIHAEVGDVPDLDVPTRDNAITAMVDHALKALGGTGYSTVVPHGLNEMP